MKKIPLEGRKGVGLFTLVDDDDYRRLRENHWFLVGEYVGRGTRNRPEHYVHIYIHREILGEIPKGLEVDHKNGNKLDNRKCNLRVCSRLQNSMNKRLRKDNESGYKGVTKNGKKWIARIIVKRNYVHLGTFENKIDAAIMYNKVARFIYGDLGWPLAPRDIATSLIIQR